MTVSRMQERKPRKKFTKYEIPAIVDTKIRDLIDMLDEGNGSDCPLLDIRDLIDERGKIARCGALEQDICYAQRPTKRYEKVEDFKDCPVYQYVAAARARRDAPPPPMRPLYY
jgi:hypothetical protein